MALGSNYQHIQSSPIMLFFMIFYKAIRDCVDQLHGQQKADTINLSLIEQFRFLGLIYEHHLKAKYEAINFSGLDEGAKNLVQEYLVRNKCENDQILEILNFAKLNEIGTQNEFVSLVETLKQSITQIMANEEEQIFPLLINNLSSKEQASTVWKYLCNIPTYVLRKLLQFLANSLPISEYRDLIKCLGLIIPEEQLLRRAIFNMIQRKDNAISTSLTQSVKFECHRGVSTRPIDAVLLWHKAIKNESKDTFEKMKKMYLSGDFTGRFDLVERLKFVAEICIFYSIAKDKVIFPAVYGEALSFRRHVEEERKFNEVLNFVQTAKEGSHFSSEFYSKFCSSSDEIIGTINCSFHFDESQVVPLAREKFTLEKQREILYQSLLMMPLRLIEHVIPWLVETMNDDEAQNFLSNIRFAAPYSDSCLVLLFCYWALNVDKNYSKSNKYVHRPLNLSPVLSLGCVEQPIDVIFKAHKAIRRDLEFLVVESAKIKENDEAFLHQFIGKFCLLWGMYKARHNSKDKIIFPALESKDTLHNVTRSYKIDHEQEEALFEEISCVLSELSQALRSWNCVETRRELNESVFELSNKLQVMCNSVRVVIDQHVFREEYELWPLLRGYFSVEEQKKMVGFVLGTTEANVLQSLLPWVASALTQDEQNQMMDVLKNVAMNTMFEDWLVECSKGNSVSKSQTCISEACLSHKGSSEMDKCLNLSSDRAPRKNLLRKYMTRYWMASEPRLPQIGEDPFEISASFRDHKKEVFGCDHYKRNCKVRASCCGEFFTCDLCHDQMSDHSMDRKDASEMMCMRCLNLQPIGPICNTPSCNGFPMAKYYCHICKLFDDQRNIYHCPFCNICRVGKGLGVDYFHCMSCNCCVSVKLVDHKCKENRLETSCPVCLEIMFTSRKPVEVLPCGHCVHSSCFKKQRRSNSETCLICSKSSEEKMKAKSKSKIMVYNHIEKEQMEASSLTKDKSEKRVFGFTMLLKDRLYPFLQWLVDSYFGRGRAEKMVKYSQVKVGKKENRTKDNVLVCCFVLCSLVVFCVVTSLVVLLTFKAVTTN